MAGHGEKRPRQTEKAIAALLTCGSIADAASQAGLGEHTLRRWLKDDGFKAAYLEARREVVSQTIAQVQQATGEAVETLRHVMRDEDAPARARVEAAKTVLELAIRGIEIEDYGQRLARLEAREGQL